MGAARGSVLGGGWGAVSAVLAMLAAAPARAQPERQPPPLLEVRHEDLLAPEGFVLDSVEYVLDGQPLSSGEGSAGLQREVGPGVHVLGIRAVYVGRSSLFAYVEGYRFLMRGRVTFEARPGWVIRVLSTGFARAGFAVKWEQRPAFKLEGEPRHAILSVEKGPVDLRPVSGPGGAVVASTGLAPEQLARQVIDEVLAEAQRRAPLAESCALEPVYFDFADTLLRPEAEAVLRRLSACLMRQPSLRVRLQGHCDLRGPEALNENLGHGRARTVAGYLWTLGVGRGQLVVESAGEGRPACDEDTPECRAKNRRVEFLAAER
jgi:peptidoglycan-associated lipoprotein